MSRDEVERQAAFTGLLQQPVVTRGSAPQLWPLVRRHRAELIDWFASRLGYRLVLTPTAARLFRLPLSGATPVAVPVPYEPPSRRVLVLAVVTAAAAEDADDVTTTQDLSDRVRVLTAHEDVTLSPYDPDRFAERQSFVRAVDLLVRAGALQPTARGSDDQREGWAHRRDRIGGAYEVQRDLLLRLVDPACLDAALQLAAPGGDASSEEAAARFGVMRRLLELPVCLLDDLTPAERGYLTGQRHRIVGWCTEMTGWIVEQRQEGLALIAAEETDTDLPFPRTRARDFVALMVADALLRDPGAGVPIAPPRLLRAAADVRAAHPRAMTKELADDEAVAEQARELLLALDLLRPGPAGTLVLSPAAGRFRGPAVAAVSSRLDVGA